MESYGSSEPAGGGLLHPFHQAVKERVEPVDVEVL